MHRIKDSISDYCSSEHFFFLDPQLKEYAESVLYFLADHIPENVTITSIGDLLKQMAHLDVPLPIRKAIPLLLKEFFEYISSTGRYPVASHWIEYVVLSEKNYINSFREDGSIKGETFKKKYADVNRNDPCPCGSGKKFKKCCMKLLA